MTVSQFFLISLSTVFKRVEEEERLRFLDRDSLLFSGVEGLEEGEEDEDEEDERFR